MERHFSRFGDVMSIRIFYEDQPNIRFGCALVEFSNENVAKAFICRDSYIRDSYLWAGRPKRNSTACNLPGGFTHEFFSALPCRQIHASNPYVNHIVREQPPDQDSPSNILNALNDNCLQRIFEYLPIEYLCSVADTCKKFKVNVQQISQVHFDNYTPATDSLFCLESLLRNFGSKVKSLSICT